MGLDQHAFFRKKGETLEEMNKEKFGKRRLAYWRKHNRLQGWMEQLWREKCAMKAELITRDFNCIEVQLTLEDLDRLEKDIKAKALPRTAGFFFGVDSYSCYEHAHIGHLRTDLDFIKKAREKIAEGHEVYYDSWW